MAIRRTKEMREQGTIHPTRDLIVNAAATIMKEKGVAGLHIDDVLEITGLTRGALYHHFKNVDDLRESALLATYAEGVNANIAYVRNVLASSKTAKDFRAGVLQANVQYTSNESLRAVRKLRAHAMALTATASSLTEKIAQEQQRLTDEYIAVITEAQAKGWVRESVSAPALATFIQAYSFGVIVDDVSARHASTDEWTQLIATFFETNIFSEK